MNKFYRLLAASIFVLFCLAIPLIGVSAAPSTGNQASKLLDDRIILGQTFTLSNGQTQNGNLTIFGGSVNLEQGSTVNGDVVLLGGTLNADGQISGNLSSLGGSIFLGDDTVIKGNLNLVGGSVQRSDGAQVLGQVNNSGVGQVNVSVPTVSTTNRLISALSPVLNFFGKIINAFIVAALAILVVLLWPKPTDRIALAIGFKPLITGGLGLLTIIVLPALLILLLITILLIPVSLLGFLLLAIALLLGWIAVGLEIGKRLMLLFNGKWHPALSAGIGTMILTLLAGFIGSIPCVGWLVPFIVALIGLGGVIITRGGTSVYPQPISPISEALPAVKPEVPPTVSA